ncbi:hypothetical protein [Capnocytophaga stomatis]|uniref:Uncharacterized protein n=1 Tax=Capnocytophaga stomatis TaxID=1848904 RepID=A0ABW8QCC4_9FLAO|nr:hypothetical protein [Capnocytophaga stomatis]
MIKHQFLKFRNMALLAISLIVVGCNKDIVDTTTPSAEDNQKFPVQNGTELILGEQLENPYALKNMQKAMDTLMQSVHKSVLSGKPYGRKPLEATHYYIVFIPENKEHLGILGDVVASRKFVTRNYPMDYEVKQHGENYVDKYAKSAELPVLYASVPVTETMPAVPYKKLEDLYLTDDKNDPDDLLEFSALYLAKALPIEHSITGKPAESVYNKSLHDHLNDNKQAFFGIFNRSYYPQGTVRVQNSNGNYQPLQNAEVEIYNWFFNAYCYTDYFGYFKCPERFRREMGVYITFRGKNATIRSSWNELIGIRVSDKLGNISGGENKKTFDVQYSDTHIWQKAITHNAINEFNKSIKRYGIKQRINGLNVWVLGGSGRGAAPMLNKYFYGTTHSSLLEGWVRWLSPITIPITNILGLAHRHLFPDVILNFTNVKNQELNEKLIYHELAHVIHAQQAGIGFWSKFVGVTVNNIVKTDFRDPYRDGIQPNVEAGQLIALCEGWANFLEHRIMTDDYAYDYDDLVEEFEDYETGSRYSLETFRMHTVPTSVKNTREEGWFLHGLMWDISDFPEDTPTLFNGITEEPIITSNMRNDQVRIGIDELFEALGNRESVHDLKSKLRQLHPAQSDRIERLFNAYGY